MASERDIAINEVIPSPPDLEPNLNSAISAAESYRRLELINSHELNKIRTNLGWFGKVFGSESNAPIVIAFVMIVLGFGTAIALWCFAYRSQRPEFWTSEAHLSLAAATSALGYVFGRGSKESNR